jgi:AraC family transcriptional regulator
MTVLQKALWHIETRLSEPLDLAALSRLCAVSPYHLSRTFRSGAGLSLMAYLRARRLSEAAKRLAEGEGDILQIALEAQYGSHEAFTRAFAACFGVVPSTVRTARSIATLKLQEPIEMDKTRIVDLPAPEMKDRPAFEVVGLGTDCTFETTSAIPPLWQALNARGDEIDARPGAAAYGLCMGAGDEGRFRYVAGLEVAKGAEVPRGMERAVVPAGRYAVFLHRGHISDIGKTCYTIWNKALPDLGQEPRKAPDFERYDRRFDPETGRGEVEIWIPVED